MKTLKTFALAALGILLLAGPIQTATAQDVDRTKYPDSKEVEYICSFFEKSKRGVIR